MAEIYTQRFDVHVLENIFNSYQKLMCTMSDYHFNYRCNNYLKRNQNEVNQEILDELSFFYPILLMTIRRIIASERFVSSEFTEELTAHFNSLSIRLQDATTLLKSSENMYHKTWNDLIRPGYWSEESSFAELGEERNWWRKTRNNACVTLLDFYRELVEINIALYYKTFDYVALTPTHGMDEETNSIIELLNFQIKELKHSKNYYCYLTEEEKDELTEEKFHQKYFFKTLRP